MPIIKPIIKPILGNLIKPLLGAAFNPIDIGFSTWLPSDVFTVGGDIIRSFDQSTNNIDMENITGSNEIPLDATGGINSGAAYDKTAFGFLDTGAKFIFSTTGITMFALVKSTTATLVDSIVFDFGSRAGDAYGMDFTNAGCTVYSPVNHGGAFTQQADTFTTDWHFVVTRIVVGGVQEYWVDGVSCTSASVSGLTGLTATEIFDSATHMASLGPVTFLSQSKTQNWTTRDFRGLSDTGGIAPIGVTDDEIDELNAYGAKIKLTGSSPIASSYGLPRNRKMLISTDWWTDCDDVLAMRIFKWAEDKTFIDIKGIGLDATYWPGDVFIGPESLDAMLIGEGRTNNNISQCDTDHIPSGSPPYQDNMEANNAHSETTWLKNTIAVWRQELVDAEDGSMEICSVGYMNGITEVMQSPADGISPLTGLELFALKVSKVWVMAGLWPAGSENNFTRTAQSRAAGNYFCLNNPTPVTFLGFEIGDPVITGENMAIDSPADDIVRVAYFDTGFANGRSSWDPMLAMLAIIGDETQAGYSTVVGTAAVDAGTGANTFVNDAGGLHRYVTKDETDEWYENRLNNLSVLLLQSPYLRTTQGNKV